ncbi:hypothetical protein SNEBB_010096 [Seison nebaliae]|nr:hypothetical protein SNEBB_010096 [Seison nebaliae]
MLNIDATYNSQSMVVENMLFTTVVNDRLTPLLNRLTSFCEKKLKFCEHEQIYTTDLNAKSSDHYLHLTFNDSTQKKENVNRNEKMIYNLKYATTWKDRQQASNRRYPILERNVIGVLATNDVKPTIELMGLKLKNEFVKKGTVFIKGPVKVTVCQVLKLNKETMTNSHLVEITTINSNYYTDKNFSENTLNSFADLLNGLLLFRSLDTSSNR